MITALKNKEGLWLRFTTKSGGKEALILVSKIVKGCGGIVTKAVEDCAAEMLESETHATNKQSAPLCPKCGSSYTVQIASPWGCDNCGNKW